MSRLRVVVVLAAACSAALAEETAPHPTFEVRARALYLEVWGEVEAGETKAEHPIHGETSNVREDLELKGGPGIEMQASLYLGRDDRVTGRFLYGGADREFSLDREFEFNGERFYPMEDLKVEINLGIYGAEYDHRIVEHGGLSLWVGAGVALQTVNVHMQLEKPQKGHIDLDNGERIKAVAPYLHAAVEADLGEGFLLRADGRGSPISIPVLLAEPGDDRFLALGVAVGWRLADWISIDAGLDFQWHSMRFVGPALDGTPDLNRFRLKFVGPSFGVHLRF
jgi:hypothetical protein